MLLIYKDLNDNYRFRVGDIVRVTAESTLIDKGVDCEIIQIDKNDKSLPYRIRPIVSKLGGWWLAESHIELVRRG